MEKDEIENKIENLINGVVLKMLIPGSTSPVMI